MLGVRVRLVRLGKPKRPGSETFRDNDQRSRTLTTRVVVLHIQEVRRVYNAIYIMQTVLKCSKIKTIISNPQFAPHNLVSLIVSIYPQFTV